MKPINKFDEILNSSELLELFAEYSLQEHLEPLKPMLKKLLMRNNMEQFHLSTRQDRKNTYDEESTCLFEVLNLVFVFREMIQDCKYFPEIKISLTAGAKKSDTKTVVIKGSSFVNALSDFAADYAFDYMNLRYSYGVISKFSQDKLFSVGMGKGLSFNDAYDLVGDEIEDFAESEKEAALLRAFTELKKPKKTGRPQNFLFMSSDINSIHKYLQENNTALKSETKIISQKQAEFIYRLLTFLKILEADKEPGYEGAEYIRTIIANTRRKK